MRGRQAERITARDTGDSYERMSREDEIETSETHRDPATGEACRSRGAAADLRSREANEMTVIMHELDVVSNSFSHRSAPNLTWNGQSG